MQDIAAILSTSLYHHRAGRLGEAEIGYREALAASPDQPSALYLYGTLLLSRGEHQVGEPMLMRAATLRPADTEIRLTFANSCHRRGDKLAAIALWRQILAIEPGHQAASLNLAGQRRSDGDWREAVETCRAALAYRPESAALWLALAAGLLMGQVGPAALTAADAALELDAGLPDAWLIRGTVLARRREFAPALDALRRSLAIDPASARACLHLGNALIDMDRMAEAEPYLLQAIAQNPRLAEAHTSLGFLRSSLHDLAEAADCHRRALAVRPDFAEAHSNLSATLLLDGDFAAGFAEYEWRKHNPVFAACYWASAKPEWSGQSLIGRRILVFCEQGFGDSIMCARYLPVLAGLGGAIILVCAAPLISLLGGLPGIVAVVPRGDPRSQERLAPGELVPDYDFWIDQMSLPRVLGTDEATIPAPAGYLAADPALVAAWRARLPKGPKLGFAWAGNPGHHNDHRRSMAGARLEPLLAPSRGCTRVSLQRGGAQPGLLDIGPGLTDFAQTAAAIACLDLVICVDTSVAHLAAAMGKPVWLMLPYAAEWRWMVGRPDSPWYASMRLWRQPYAGAWDAVVAQIAAALPAFIESSIG